MEHWSRRMLRALRLRGWSYVDLAKRSSVSQERIKKYAQGVVEEPRGRTLEKISRALGVELDWLKMGHVTNGSSFESPGLMKGLANADDQASLQSLRPRKGRPRKKVQKKGDGAIFTQSRPLFSPSGGLMPLVSEVSNTPDISPSVTPLMRLQLSSPLSRDADQKFTVWTGEGSQSTAYLAHPFPDEDTDAEGAEEPRAQNIDAGSTTGRKENVLEPFLLGAKLAHMSLENHNSIPFYDMASLREASALATLGDGSQGVTPKFWQFFDRNFLSSVVGVSPTESFGVIYAGDEMAQTICEGACLFVDYSAQHILGDGIYLLRWLGGLLVRRLSINPATGLVRILTDNQLYPSYQDIHPDDLGIVGRVGWLAQKT